MVSLVYHEVDASRARLGLEPSEAVKLAFAKVKAGTHLPFQRRRKDGGLDYILVRKTERVTRFLRAVNVGAFR